MSSFIFPDESGDHNEIDIDELYEANHKKDLKQLSIFNKILNRVHTRIKMTNRQRPTQKYIWFVVPQYIFGEPLYDKSECIGYMVMKLNENGFHVRYTHPSTLFVSWSKWIPDYVRQEVKARTGQVITAQGEIVAPEPEPEPEVEEEPEKPRQGKSYRSTSKYKPTGSLVYDDEAMEKLEKSVRFDL
jgi:hypothetical protein